MSFTTNEFISHDNQNDWEYVELNDIQINDYLRGNTSTNSQKHGDDFNYTVIGKLVEKDDNYLYKCKIINHLNEIVDLCSFVGTSGYNSVERLKLN